MSRKPGGQVPDANAIEGGATTAHELDQQSWARLLRFLAGAGLPEEQASSVSQAAAVVTFTLGALGCRTTIHRHGAPPVELTPSAAQLRGDGELPTVHADARPAALFIGNDDAGEVNASFASLLGSCQLHGIEP